MKVKYMYLMVIVISQFFQMMDYLTFEGGVPIGFYCLFHMWKLSKVLSDNGYILYDIKIGKKSPKM